MTEAERQVLLIRGMISSLPESDQKIVMQHHEALKASCIADPDHFVIALTLIGTELTMLAK